MFPLRYESLADLEGDFLLLCRNAQEYNEEGSLIHTDSAELMAVWQGAKAKVLLLGMHIL